MPTRVLVLSRNYPNAVTPQLGVWVEQMVSHLSDTCGQCVISPVPYYPPLPGFAEYTRFRRIPMRERLHDVEIIHPRFVTGPGYSTHNWDATSYYWSVRNTVARLHRDFQFNLIHAHFGYPDGVVAARLAKEYHVPFGITEHAPWLPWMENFPRVRAQAVEASRQAAFHIAGSRYLKETIVHFTAQAKNIPIIPIGVDTCTFTPAASPRNLNQIVFVGRIHLIKGVDILLRAMRLLIEQRPQLHLVLVGGSFFRKTDQQEKQLHELAHDLGLDTQVEFVGIKALSDVAEYMRHSALLVLPSRAESFGAVLTEALASGIPVVATRCGGPEDIVDDQVGALVEKENPEALARGIDQVLTRIDEYNPAKLRAYAVERFGMEAIARQVNELYNQAIEKY